MFMYWLLKFTLIPQSMIPHYSTVSFSNWQLGVARVENLMLVCTYELCNDISYLNLFSNFKHCFIWLRGCLKMNESKNLKSQWMKLCERSRSKSRQIWVIDRDQESWINRDRDHKSAFDRDRDRDEKCDLTRLTGTGTGTGIAENCQSRSPPE